MQSMPDEGFSKISPLTSSKSPDLCCREYLTELDCELLSDDKSATPGAESLENQEELVVNHAGEYFSNYDEWTGYSNDGCDSNGVPHGAHGSVPGQLWSPNNVPSTDLDDDIDEELREELEIDEFNVEIEREPELERENANEPPMEEPVVDDSERHLRVHPHVVSYPDNAGQPVCPVSEKAALTDQERYLNSLGDQTNPYAPFKSRMDWEIALWAKMRGSSSSAFTDLMGIDGVVDKLGLSFKNSMELNRVIDTQLPGRPSFKRMGVELGGEVFDVYFRDIMDCVQALYSDPEFSPYLVYAPERHYVDEKCDLRMYHDMHTGEWWWSTQSEPHESAVRTDESDRNIGVKSVTEPFWKDLPYAHVYCSITPDDLHQLHQGVMKHAIRWTTEIFGAAEIDARCRRLPPNHNTQLFLKGVSTLSRVSGTEHGHICRFLLALVLDIPLPGRLDSGALVQALRKLLDFLYLAQYPIHTTETLQNMDAALQSFHDNKHIFVSLGIQDNFNIPKLHFAKHYCRSIKLFGTTDNFNTEYTERLHIDLAKDAYAATNHKDKFP
ncbi:hypothetical protein EDB84DRAFT_1582216 [Lactarius hengduanensis]|nr:hypothetical protein EDB84DRAFT_1582216 [Lactarius hengduanensis]